MPRRDRARPRGRRASRRRRRLGASRTHFAAGMSVGAPPDAFNARGQDWGLPPWRPDRLAESGYAPYRRLLRALFRYAGALRIDHVMGLFRLWWVPQGEAADRGHVRPLRRRGHARDPRPGGLTGPAPWSSARTSARSSRACARRCARAGCSAPPCSGSSATGTATGRPLPPEPWRADCLATATTHDLPSTAARLTGDHVELRDRLGLLTRPAGAGAGGGRGGHRRVAGPARPARPAARSGGGTARGGRDPGRPPLPAAHPGPHGRRLAAGRGGRPPPAEPAGHLGPVPELAAAGRGRRRAAGDAGGAGGLAPAARADGGAAGRRHEGPATPRTAPPDARPD